MILESVTTANSAMDAIHRCIDAMLSGRASARATQCRPRILYYPSFLRILLSVGLAYDFIFHDTLGRFIGQPGVWLNATAVAIGQGLLDSRSHIIMIYVPPLHAEILIVLYRRRSATMVWSPGLASNLHIRLKFVVTPLDALTGNTIRIPGIGDIKIATRASNGVLPKNSRAVNATIAKEREE